MQFLFGRFFTGHSKDDNNNVEFIAGKTSVGDAVDGAIKIFTVAVCILCVFSQLLMIVLVEFWELNYLFLINKDLNPIESFYIIKSLTTSAQILYWQEEDFNFVSFWGY